METVRADLIMAWLQQQPTRERPDTFTQLSSSSRPRTLHGRGGPYISAQCVLKHLLVEAQIGHDPPQLVVLVLELQEEG